MKIIVVSHPSRALMVAKLQEHLPIDLVVTDQVSALHGHTLALKCAQAFDERVVIMEDDAIPVVGFIEKAQAWFDRLPSELISFYLGTSRPPHYQARVDNMTKYAAQIGQDFIRLNQLIHGVCYSLPVGAAADVLPRMRLVEADFAIGAAWGRGVVYPIESLVEHRDTKPVEQHPDGQPRVERRVARKLAGELMYPP